MSWGDRVPAVASQGRRRIGSFLWALLPLLTWGLLAPVPFVHAAIRLHTTGMWLVAAIYVLAWAVVGPAGVLAQDPDPNDAVAAFSQLGLVVAATAHAFVLRPRVFPPPRAADPAVAAALTARGQRQRAREIMASDPALALSQEEAARVVAMRAQLGRFSSPPELAVYAELPDATVEAVRDRLLFLRD